MPSCAALAVVLSVPNPSKQALGLGGVAGEGFRAARAVP
jgi:hypothetical protein